MLPLLRCAFLSMCNNEGTDMHFALGVITCCFTYNQPAHYFFNWIHVEFKSKHSGVLTTHQYLFLFFFFPRDFLSLLLPHHQNFNWCQSECAPLQESEFKPSFCKCFLTSWETEIQSKVKINVGFQALDWRQLVALPRWH